MHRRIVVRTDCCGHATDRYGDWFVQFWLDASAVFTICGYRNFDYRSDCSGSSPGVFPLVAFLVAVYMLMVLTNGGRVAPEWNLYFGFSFLLMMVIPGHLLNKKAAAYAC